MANQHVEINGQRLGVWFQHAQDNEDGRLDESLDEAIRLGQVKEHVIDGPIVVGATRCYLEDENRKVVAVGYAFCSWEDQFNKAKGRQISLSRAIEWAKRAE